MNQRHYIPPSDLASRSEAFTGEYREKALLREATSYAAVTIEWRNGQFEALSLCAQSIMQPDIMVSPIVLLHILVSTPPSFLRKGRFPARGNRKPPLATLMQHQELESTYQSTQFKKMLSRFRAYSGLPIRLLNRRNASESFVVRRLKSPEEVQRTIIERAAVSGRRPGALDHVSFFCSRQNGIFCR